MSVHTMRHKPCRYKSPLGLTVKVHFYWAKSQCERKTLLIVTDIQCEQHSKISLTPSSGSSGRVRGGRETWNLCDRLRWPSFYDLFSQGRGGGHGPLSPPRIHLHRGKWKTKVKNMEENWQTSKKSFCFCFRLMWIYSKNVYNRNEKLPQSWILYCRGRVWIHQPSLSSGHHWINVSAVAHPVFLFVYIFKMNANEWRETRPPPNEHFSGGRRYRKSQKIIFFPIFLK